MVDYCGNPSTNGEVAATSKGLQSTNGEPVFRLIKKKVELIAGTSKKRRETSDFVQSQEYIDLLFYMITTFPHIYLKRAIS